MLPRVLAEVTGVTQGHEGLPISKQENKKESGYRFHYLA